MTRRTMAAGVTLTEGARMSCCTWVRSLTSSLCVAVVFFAYGCGISKARTTARGIAGVSAPTAAPATRAVPPRAHPAGGTSNLTAEEQDAMAAELPVFYVEVAPWEYTLGYVDDDALHVWSVVRLGDDTPMPFTGVISGLPQIVPEEEGFTTIASITPPVRHLNRPDGMAEPGYFEPRTGAFFRWRGVVRPQDPAVPVVDPEKLVVIVDIDPPA